MKLRMIGLSLALGLLLVGCGAEKVTQESTEAVVDQTEETTAEETTESTVVETEEQSDTTEETTVAEEETKSPADSEAVDEETEEADSADAGVSGADLFAQLTVIYENRADWYTADLEMGSYTVTDLDQNGKMEVLAAVCSGSGMYTYTDIWEVNGDTLTKCTRLMDEYESQADTIVSETVAYAVDGGWEYIFYDTVRMGVMGYNCDLRGVNLRDGTITETTYASLGSMVDGEQEVVEASMADGTALTEDEFYALKDHLMETEKRQVSFRWINVYDGEFDLNAASEAEAVAKLGELYAAFGLN